MTADCVGGVWTYALDLARGLSLAGVEVVLATMGDLPNEQHRRDAQQIPGLTLCPGAFKLEWMFDCWQDVERAGGWLLDLEAQFSPDVIHLNGYVHAALDWNAPVLVAGHSCVLSWWQAVWNTYATPEWQRYREEVTQGVQSAQAVVAPTQAMRNALTRYYGPLPPAHVIFNGRQPDLYRSEEKEPFILTAGRVWDEAKNVAALQTVAPNLAWPVYIAGSDRAPGHEGGETGGETSVTMPANTRFLGRLAPARLADWYARAAIYALPARYEPFGLSILEAALSGCALVLGDIASLREVWQEAALFVPPDDLDALRHALDNLIADPDLRRDMADRALRHAQRYSLRAMTNAYLDLYGSLIAPLPSETILREVVTPPACRVRRLRLHRLRFPRLRERSSGHGGLRSVSRLENEPKRANKHINGQIIVFCHSLLSDWNHGNAHFLRGIVSELKARGEDVIVYEPCGNWSLQNLLAEAQGLAAVENFYQTYPDLDSVFYEPALLRLDRALANAKLVLVHEWSDHAFVLRLGQHRRANPHYRLLFHDTHHRSVTDRAGMAAYDLSDYDGVLAFGNVVRDLYLAEGWTNRAWTWHEAADTRVFHPQDTREEESNSTPKSETQNPKSEGDLVWIGNWGDEERTAELHEFLLGPVQALGLKARVYGVRYPSHALAALEQAGIEYGGWLPNADAPSVFARYRVTVHVPRGPYTRSLPGIPTIRVFEALACGIPLVCSPWNDAEHLFTPGADFLTAQNGQEMQRHLQTLLDSPAQAQALAAHGLQTVRARHTCAHRADELLAIYDEIR